MSPSIFYGGESWTAIAACQTEPGRVAGLRFAFGKWRIEDWPAEDVKTRRLCAEFEQDDKATALGAFAYKAL